MIGNAIWTGADFDDTGFDSRRADAGGQLTDKHFGERLDNRAKATTEMPIRHASIILFVESSRADDVETGLPRDFSGERHIATQVVRTRIDHGANTNCLHLADFVAADGNHFAARWARMKRVRLPPRKTDHQVLVN